MNWDRHRPLPLIALALAAMLAACSKPAPTPDPAPAPAMPAAAPAATPTAFTGPEAPFLKDNAQAMDKMMVGMDVPPSGDVDKDFARMMIPHHQGGIDMAEAQLKYGKNEELKTLARNIIAKQQEEIALMRRIIGEPAAAPTADAAPTESMGSMGSMDHEHHM